MVLKHNNQLPNQHFRKDWQRRVKTWFDQPGRKKSRRVARIQKAARIAPRPVDGLLRPAVRCPTQRYNMKLRAGRGFTLDELKVCCMSKRNNGKQRNKRKKQRNITSLLIYYVKFILFFLKNGIL